MLDACESPDDGEDIDPEEALDIVEPIFEDVLGMFHEAGLPLNVVLHCAPWVHDSPRHFAACSNDGRSIVVAPQIVTLDTDMISAILAHELGHATDFTWPARFLLKGNDLTTYRPAGELAYRQALAAWRARPSYMVERTADAIAEQVTGRKIGYCGPCLIQCFDAGRARPKWLR